MKKAILAIVLTIFVLGLCSTAMADSILFPWVAKGPSVMTLISVVNTSDRETITRSQTLHYEYYWKDTSPTSASQVTDCCTPASYTKPTSMNDLVSFDAGGNVNFGNSGNALFNDTGIDGYVTNYQGSFKLPVSNNYWKAFLIIDNNDTEVNENPYEASLYGEAMVIELGAGAAWGYIAYNGSFGGPDFPVTFADGQDMQGEVLRSPRYFDDASNDDEVEATPAVLLPLTSFQTKLYVTPVDYRLWEYEQGPGQRQNCLNSRVELCLDPRPAEDAMTGSNLNTCPSGLGTLTLSGDNCQSNDAPACRHSGIFDNDESPLDGNSPVDVVCTAALSLSSEGQLLTSSQIDYLLTENSKSANGKGGSAWTYVRSMVGGFFTSGQLGGRDPRTYADSIIGKLQYGDSIHPASIDGTNPLPGAVNDFEWIRNSGSLIDSAWQLQHGINYISQDDNYGD